MVNTVQELNNLISIVDNAIDKPYVKREPIFPNLVVRHPNWKVRRWAAMHGLGLELLINDKHAAVRIAVAKQGVGLDVLSKDINKSVADAARMKRNRK